MAHSWALLAMMDSVDPRRRHVWVDVSGGGQFPGLIIAWRHGDDGWEG